MLVGIDTVLKEAQKGGYAVGSFNTMNMETTTAILGVAVKKKSPVIIQIIEYNLLNMTLDELARRFKPSPKDGKPQSGHPVRPTEGPGQISLEETIDMVRDLAADLPIPVVVHLDHGRTFDRIVRAIYGGCTSVMFDGSTLPFDENVSKTEEIVKIAHAAGVSVEAEIGHVDYGMNYADIKEDKDHFLTNPEDALEFVKRTGVDCLAVAVGTAHGKYIGGEPKIDFERLDKIRQLTDVPLVLHGGSSTGDQNLAKAVSHGVTKINIATDLDAAAVDGIKKVMETTEKWRLLHLLLAMMDSFGEMAGHYMDVFGSSGKA